MHDNDKKARFIELRAQGKSYSKIADELQISKATCTEWNRDLDAEIAKRSQEHLEELYREYGMQKEARIQRLGGTLQRINTAISEKDLSEMPVKELLELKLKYEAALQAEYVEPSTPINGANLEAILDQYKLILANSQSGRATPAQTKAQIAVVQETLAVMRSIHTRDNPIEEAFGMGGTAF